MYLGTTRLDDFWPAERPLTLLGEWCLKEDEILKDDYHSPHSILAYPWDDADRFERASMYVQELYEKTLQGLANALNSIHGMDMPVSYWRVIIGPWLAWYLEAFYDRYTCIQDALKLDHDIVTIGLDSESYMVPIDFLDFTDLYLDDEYNLMLYTQILESLGIKIKEQRKISSSKDRIASAEAKIKEIEKIKSIPLNLFQSVCTALFMRSSIGLIYTGLSFKTIISLCSPRKFRMFACRNFAVDGAFFSGMDYQVRSHIKEYLTVSDEFERVVAETISQNIPLSYIETFLPRRERFVSCNRFPRAILSAVGWYFDEMFKIYAAEAQNKGSKLLALQHGGYYGMLKYMSPEIHEQTICERFYSWGWYEGLADKSNIFPMPSLKILNLKDVMEKRRGKIIKGPILMVTTKHPRYLYRFQSHCVGPQWKQYFMWELRFVKNLNKKFSNNLKIRLYPHSYGWGLKKFWMDNIPDISFANKDKMSYLLASSSIIVIDHPSTTILESLALNIPTILYWNHSRFIMRSTALPFLDELKSVGILHESPESAASMINQIADDPLSWWTLSSVQSVRDKFCNFFAKSSEDWIKQWKSELFSVAGVTCSDEVTFNMDSEN